MFGFNVISFVKAAGYLGVGGFVFAESGLLIGFFLPGDSLLFTAGVIAAAGTINISWLLFVAFIAAVLGDNVGYYIGRKIGPAVFTREKSFWFNPKHAERAEAFFSAYGARSVILARFVPVVRTFIPTMAGVGRMPYSTFLKFNIVGGLLWVFGITMLGYSLGAAVPNAEHYILPIILLIVAVSFIPAIIHVVRERRS